MKKFLQNNLFIFWGLSIAFLLLTGYAIISEQFYLLAIPYVLGIVWVALKAIDKLLFLIIFLVPLSVPMSEFFSGLPINMFIPTEPLVAGVLLLFLILLPTQKWINKDLLYHPVTVASAVLMIWMLLTTVTSTMPVVSIKFFFMRLWFLITFYYMMVLIIRKPKDIEKLVWLYTIPMVIVIAYGLTRHATYGIFDKKIAHWAANPFFKDHTIYGAALAFYVPFLTLMAFRKGKALLTQVGTVSLLVIFSTALIFSYSRAAWLSVGGALILYIIIRLKINWKYIVGLSIIALIAGGFMWNRIMIQLEQNRQESSVSNIGEHVKSMTNITSDASNLERINRWKSAFRMFNEKPLLGFGPGTYMFQYAPYQMSYERTIISTNAANRGNAHSEYFGPLSEQGFPGMLTYIALITAMMITGIRRYYLLEDPTLKRYLMGAILGLATYILHGFLNNFLDTDKISVPFWGFTAIIVAIDLHHRQLSKNGLKKLESK